MKQDPGSDHLKSVEKKNDSVNKRENAETKVCLIDSSRGKIPDFLDSNVNYYRKTLFTEISSHAPPKTQTEKCSEY